MELEDYNITIYPGTYGFWFWTAAGPDGQEKDGRAYLSRAHAETGAYRTLTAKARKQEQTVTMTGAELRARIERKDN